MDDALRRHSLKASFARFIDRIAQHDQHVSGRPHVHYDSNLS